jgi:hypothetical protein
LSGPSRLFVSIRDFKMQNRLANHTATHQNIAAKALEPALRR